ncbi:glycosyltransferase family 2 protein [Phenylobacterium sp.]|uniref:glycosyltransferase family 2 protein n=1 Tax=Phenylobacterium sp. TaxID=1871053 RepID=UPI00286DE7E2|nr:glycosyltransferase family 2 protein [Phenylobacterium sp.]
MADERPLVSIITANHNGAEFLAAAARSVLSQSLTAFEWIIADDASTDDSLAVIAAACAGDPRVRVMPATVNGGPAVARNRALAAARGAWLAVFDSDDLMEPDRLERLLAEARSSGADIVVDNVRVFSATDPTGQPLLTGQAYASPRWVSLADYIASSRMYAPRPGLGYLKPMFNSEKLGPLRYRENLKIGEDYDLVLNLMARGARLRLTPPALYGYRKHGASISAVMRADHLVQMMAADAEFEAGLEAHPPQVRRAQQRRRRSLETALAYDTIICALKRRDLRAGFVLSLRQPRAWPLLTLPVRVRFQRLWARLSTACRALGMKPLSR